MYACAPCLAVVPSPGSQFVAKMTEDGATVGAVNVIYQDREG